MWCGVVWCGGAEDKYVIFLLYCMSQAAVNGDSEVDDVGRKLRVEGEWSSEAECE